ncbi:AcrR family transcriptional regulator [Kibdelosporangium banguiense]|uniref:AcrR family transcriptional regulator n=1 Tax=Kibdelosporangium banguiense TaxID=1365924 RepID=A0ABS4THZ3_9PSEU|nr:TetR/AcrR family transcriptional regulator [Kibdelosporangium banguiense]MBP2323630.1 AcrR family transcriptional regulator [Kibdelosporangium banguiense]
MGTRSDTREKIQDVALELFGEQGYDKTSLREIAEHLGVTKAALYYHFKTKEEIISSLLQATGERMDVVAAWLADKQPTPETRAELLRRYAAAVVSDSGRHFRLMRLMQENQPALRELAAGMRGQERLKVFFEFLVEPGAPLADQLRARLSFMVLHMGMFALKEADATQDEKQAAALEVSLGLLDQLGGSVLGAQ